MKYIRTKDGRIVEITDYCFKNKNGSKMFGTVKGTFPINEWNIIKQADTIEELCDRFVILFNNGDFTFERFVKWLLKNYAKYHAIYGAILTDKGLIYVAKVNEKGEFELL